MSLIIVCGPFSVIGSSSTLGSSSGLSDETESSPSTSASRESKQKGYRQLEAEKTDKMKDDQEKGEKEDVQEITEKGDDEKLVEKDKEENKNENKKEDKEKDEKDLKISGSPEGDVILINPTEDPRIDPTEDRDEIEPGDKLVRAAAKNDMKEVKRLLDSGVKVDTPGRLAQTSWNGFGQNFGPNFDQNFGRPRPMPRPRKGSLRRLSSKRYPKDRKRRRGFLSFRRPSGQTTALIEASRNKHLEMMKFLIDKEADPNKCLQRECPLCAVVSGRNASNIDIEAMKILKDAGADLDTKCKRATPILLAARNSLKLVKELLKMGADPQVKFNDYVQNTLLQTVISSNTYNGNPEEVLEVVKVIIKRDPEAVNRTNKYNQTALLSVLGWRYRGSQEETLEIVKVLVQNGADVNTVDDRGNTPLMRAASGNNKENTLEIVKFLVQNGADVNAIDKMGFTPLIHAADGNNPAVVKLLLDKNADVNVQNKYQETPLMMLLKARNTTNSMDIAKMLLEKGADPNAQMDKLDYGDGSDSGGTPQTVSIFDQAKKMLRDRKERERKAKEESEKMQKMVQLLEQYADKKGF